MKKLSLILFLLFFLGCALPSVAFAAETDKYTDVLTDLQKDETFDVALYPEKANDYSLDVFQVAESKDGEVFLYVYQPSGESVTATDVRISTSIGENLSPQDYKITLVDIDGTVGKYLVKDLNVKTDTVRYYFVIQIARQFHEKLGDKKNNNNVSTVPFPVGKLFTACTVDGNVTYGETHEDVITVIDKYVGFVRYYSGWAWINAKTDSHFVAFNTDKNIEKLMEAEVFFVYREYIHSKDILTNHYEYKEQQDKTVTLKATSIINNPEIGIFAHKYSWKQIQPVSEFLKEDLTDEAKSQIRQKSWVLRFTETPFTEVSGMYPGIRISATEVTEVTILRLKFETEGRVYNLGVVDNKQSGSSKPSNKNEELLDGIKEAIKRFFNWINNFWWVLVLGIVALVLVIVIIIEIVKHGFPAVIKAIGNVLLLIFKVIWYILSAPVRLVALIVQSVKDKRQ